MSDVRVIQGWQFLTNLSQYFKSIYLKYYIYFFSLSLILTPLPKLAQRGLRLANN